MPARNAAKPHSRAHRRPVSAGARAALVDLPAAGCELPVPPLPPGREWSVAEAGRWEELWQSPQATQWDDTVRGTVAVLIVYESAILAGEASAWMAQEARHAGEALGLTPKAMAALGWRIVEAVE
ncbi:phage terminase small subunit [Nocardiopsis nanhaiensis]